MAFSELIRNFDKIRDYMRDFYVYGFKQRGDFNRKSARTYDDEKRRIESYLNRYINWSYDKSGKRTFISLDSSAIEQNPLYAAWKSKSFTSKDIMLHFYILDALRDCRCTGGSAAAAGKRDNVGEPGPAAPQEKIKTWLNLEELTDRICLQSECLFEQQTVRIKCSEYVKEGILKTEKRGKTFYYSLSESKLDPEFVDAVKFYQEAAPFGEVGSFILDNLQEKNDLFRFKHHYVVHTLEDQVLLLILQAMREKRSVTFTNQSTRSNRDSVLTGVPVRIFSSASTGRRYACVYFQRRRRFLNFRLDYIKTIELNEICSEYDQLSEALERNSPLVWGVSFGRRTRKEILCMKLYIEEEKEKYVLERLYREGRDGEILRLEENVFLYTKEVYDTSEMSPWIKTFTGRILSLEGSNRVVVDRFYSDMEELQRIYEDAAEV